MTRTPRIIPPTEDNLHAEIARLNTRLAACQLESANRLAAIRAALAAAADNESDPLEYLRDQIAEETANLGLRGSLSPDAGGARGA